MGGINHTENTPFSLTVAECIFYIQHGCELFVLAADGNSSSVHIVRTGGRGRITTAHDTTRVDNLYSLPEC